MNDLKSYNKVLETETITIFENIGDDRVFIRNTVLAYCVGCVINIPVR